MTAMYRTENPATGEVGEEFETLTDDGVQQALETAHQGYLTWRDSDVQERVRVLEKVADLYEQRADELAAAIALEMGKPLAEGKGEVGLAAAIYRYYAANGPAALKEEISRLKTERDEEKEKA